MSLIRTEKGPPIKLQLGRDLVKTIKRGHAWVYPEALRGRPQASPGTPAILLDNRGGREIARGYYDPKGAIALRICSAQRGQKLDDSWAAGRMSQALSLRRSLFNEDTTGYRLFNGEGDGLPGLVCDIYQEHAVIKLDGPAAEHFWQAEEIARWLAREAGLKHVYQRFRQRAGSGGQTLLGDPPGEMTPFLENGVRFTANLVKGQKTGFFFDQRDNRAWARSLAGGKRVLNVFGYTGGFSVYAGLGGAAQVTTIDTAKAALNLADQHWLNNDLPPDKHESAAVDAFDYLAEAQKQGKSWDLVILDPPSFAPSEAAIPQAAAAYTRLIATGAQVTAPGGLLAAASCSSHIDQTRFMEICETAISQARRTATLLGVRGQPADHPAPLVMPELRYLKFVLMKVL